MTRMWVGLSLSVKVSWLSWFNIRVGIGDEEWISMIWLRGGRWLSLGRYVRIGGKGIGSKWPKLWYVCIGGFRNLMG